MSLVETVRAAAGGLAADVVDAAEVRVLCPRGHCIAELAVIRLRGGLVLTSALDAPGRAEFAAELAELAQAAPLRPPRGTPGWVRQSGERLGVHTRGDVVLACPHKRCAYRGSFEYYGFSADVGATAERSDEHRLID